MVKTFVLSGSLLGKESRTCSGRESEVFTGMVSATFTGIVSVAFTGMSDLFWPPANAPLTAHDPQAIPAKKIVKRHLEHFSLKTLIKRAKVMVLQKHGW